MRALHLGCIPAHRPLTDAHSAVRFSDFSNVVAEAAVTHVVSGQFPTGAGTAEGVAVDSSNDVYVIDQSGRDILKFDSNGNPVNFSALGTNVLNGSSQPTEKTPSNGFVFENSSGSAVAVDNSGGPANGEIYVTNNGPKKINVFSAAGEYLGDLPASFGEPLGLSINSAGTVIVGDWSSGRVLGFVPKSASPAEDTLAGSLNNIGFRPGSVAIDSTGAA